MLTVEPDGSVRLPAGVLGDALVGAKVRVLDAVDGEAHVVLVGRAALAGLRPVLAAVVDHVAVFACPVVERRGMRLRMTLQGHVEAEWGAHELVRDPQHRRD